MTADLRMTFWEHLKELRTRLFRAVLALGVGVAVAWTFRAEFLSFLVRPLYFAYRTLGIPAPSLHFAGPADAFVAYLQLSLVGGLFVASPIILWELWGFISPGLYSREKRYAIPFVFFATSFFVGGAFFSYRLVLPVGFKFFLGFAGELGGVRLEPVLMMDQVLDFTTKILLAFGLVFELPLVISFLALAGIVDHRQLWRFSRWAILIAAAVAAVLTPPDALSMVLMAGPLVGLYFLSIALAYFLGPKKAAAGKEAAAAAAPTKGDRPPK